MKELTIEEKAKAYDEALEKARCKYQDHDTPWSDEDIEDIFPELAESEDERVRKALIFHFQGDGYLCNKVGNIPNTDILAWLEKQGEQKPVDLVAILKDYFANTPKEQQDKDLEELKHLNNFGWKLIEQKPAWSEEDCMMIESIIQTLEIIGDKGANRMKIDFLKSLKSRVQPQPMQEWSEEDKDMCYKAIAVINRLCAEGKDYVWSIKTLKKLFYWLKSIRPQNRWKPSDEQIEALEHFVRNIAESGFASPYDINTKLVCSLFNDLKKLREE